LGGISGCALQVLAPRASCPSLWALRFHPGRKNTTN